MSDNQRVKCFGLTIFNNCPLGIFVGEMERDAVISHAASSFLRERLMLVSDGYKAVFCRVCGTFAVNNPITSQYRPCILCGKEKFGHCTIPYVFKLLVHLLAPLGLNLRPEFLTMAEYADKVLTASGAEIIHAENEEEEEDEEKQEEIEEEDYEKEQEEDEDYYPEQDYPDYDY